MYIQLNYFQRRNLVSKKRFHCKVLFFLLAVFFTFTFIFYLQKNNLRRCVFLEILFFKNKIVQKYYHWNNHTEGKCGLNILFLLTGNKKNVI